MKFNLDKNSTVMELNSVETNFISSASWRKITSSLIIWKMNETTSFVIQIQSHEERRNEMR